MTYGKIWKFVYKFYPPILRVLEALRFHSGRQSHHVGFVKDVKKLSEIKIFLRKNEFEDVILAWKDTGETLSMRKVDKEVFQYHVRCFKDGEVTGHYEYSSEGNPWGHIRESLFESRGEYFLKLLKRFLK